MDLVERDDTALDIGDASLLKSIPSKNSALKNGVIASICLCDGKSIKSLASYIASHQAIVMEFGVDGLEIKAASIDETTKKIDFIDHLVFKIENQLEYCFCPQNLENVNDKSCVCLAISSDALLSCVSSSKVGTSLRLEYNQKRKTDIAASVINGGVVITKYISTVISQPQVLQVTGDITTNKFEPKCKIVSDLFSLNMTNNSKKVRNVHYGSIIEIYNDGMKIQSKAPKVEPIVFGDDSGTSFVFHLDHKTTTRLAKLAKISPKTPIFIDADERVIKITMAVGAYSSLTIYQYPNSFPPQSVGGYNQSSVYSGVSQEDMIKYQQYQAQLNYYFDGMVKSGQMNQNTAEMTKTAQLQQAWMFILTQTQQRMMNANTGYQQIHSQARLNQNSTPIVNQYAVQTQQLQQNNLVRQAPLSQSAVNQIQQIPEYKFCHYLRFIHKNNLCIFQHSHS